MNNIIDLNKYYLINWEKWINFDNLKLKDFLILLKQNDNFVFINDTKEHIIDFFKRNHNKSYILIFPIYFSDYTVKNFLEFRKKNFNFLNELIFILRFLNNFNITRNKIIFSTRDYWNPCIEKDKQNKLNYIRFYFNKELYNCKNHYIFTPCNKKDFNNYILNSTDYSHISKLQKDKIIKKSFEFQTFYSYYFMKLIEPTINKIVISGNLNKALYEERNILLKYKKNIEKLEYNINHRLNNKTNNYIKKCSLYKSCFYSTCFNKKNLIIPEYTICHKLYEILSSGSLLLASSKNENALNNVGLYHLENCIIINCYNENDINKKINFICNDKNNEIINKIRKNGFELAKNNFTYKEKYNEFLNIINKIKLFNENL